MIEIFKDIKGYEGKYQISNLGNVYSCNKRDLLIPDTNKDGYFRYHLYKDGKCKKCLAHRLVAEAFIPNPDNLECVNHIDENKTNNCVDNLEWCTKLYNNIYGSRIENINKKLYKPVIGINITNGLIVKYNSIKEASEVLGIDKSSISACCKGKIKSIGGYTWFYENPEDNKSNSKPKAKGSKRAIVGVNSENGSIVEFNSIIDATRALGINNGSISKCLNKKTKIAGLYYWYYADEYKNNTLQK